MDGRSRTIGARTARWWQVPVRHVAALVLLGLPLSGQQSPTPLPQPGNGRLNPHNPNNPNNQNGPVESSFAPDKKRLRLLNVERQKEIVSDTARLLQLAQELNAEVAGKEASGMTAEDLRKVAEIGKLAKSVKQKMSFGVGSSPSLLDPIGP